MKRIALLVALLAACIAAGTAVSQAPVRQADMPYSTFLPRRWHKLGLLNVARARHCRPAVSFGRSSHEIPPWHRREHLDHWTVRIQNEKSRQIRCSSPAATIRFVFPAYAEDQALRVAGCESTGTPYRLNPRAKNPRSTASGLFQLLDTWWAGKFDPFDPFANTREAYRLWLGSGNSFARHWSASIGCWG